MSHEEPVNIGIVVDNDSDTSLEMNPTTSNLFTDTISKEKTKEEQDWSGANLETLCKWIQTASLQIATLDIAIQYYRSIVRRNVLLGLVFSTASGSISLSQMNSTQQQFAYNVIFTILSFSTAIFTGLIKRVHPAQTRMDRVLSPDNYRNPTAR